MVYIDKGIVAIDLALYIPAARAIIFSDFHVGYEEMLNTQGTLIPRFQLKDTLARLDGIFDRINEPVETVIINGDLKHEFGGISAQEWREVLKLLDYFSKKAERTIIVKGNHDVALGPIARKRKVEVVTDYVVGDILVSHGDEVADEEELKKIKTIIIGHDHPAIGVREHRRVETFKCFLKGKWKSKTLIVQPSFNVLVEGTDVLAGEFLSPYLQRAIGNFEAWVVARPDEVLYFGRIRNIPRADDVLI